MKIFKRLYLKTHGWEQCWHRDNWVQKGKQYANVDWAGLDTEKAYKEAKKPKKNGIKFV